MVDTSKIDLYVADRQAEFLKEMDQDSQQAETYKYNSHERLFKMILNSTTLALTAWVVIVGWKFEAYPSEKYFVIAAIALFVFALILISLGDMFIMLQSKAEEWKFAKARHIWVRGCQEIVRAYDLSSSMGISYSIDSAEIEQQVDNVTEQIEENTKSDIAKAHRFYQLSWQFGVGGYIAFFIAVLFSAVAMPRYISIAGDLSQKASGEIAKTAANLPVLIHPREARTCER